VAVAHRSGYPHHVARRLALLCIALALVIAAPARAQTTERTITVTGVGSVSAPNDTASISLGVATTHYTAAAALSDTSRRTRHVFDALAAQGIAKDDIQTDEVGLQRSTRTVRKGKHRRRRVVYTASNSVIVTVRDVSKTGAVVQAAVKAGATNVEGADFFVSNSDALYRQALALGYDDARAKATVLAQRAGVTLGQVVSIQEGQDALPSGGSGDFSTPVSGAPPIAAGTATISAFVTVVYAIS
jgi:uncharacterized protein YggE